MLIEKAAFEFSRKAQGIDTIEDLELLFRKYTSPYGVQFHLFGQLIQPGGVTDTTLLFDCSHSAWFRYYKQNYYFLDDPAVRISREATAPYTWSWVLANVKLSKPERRTFDEAKKFGLTEGIVYPFHGPRGALGGASIAGSDLKTGPSEMTAFQLMVQTAYHRAVSIKKIFDGEEKFSLTGRQRDCLNWAQHGKNYDEIASILGISPHTVKEHIDAAKKALGVSTRIEAVICARDANLIGFSPVSDRTA